MKVKITLKEGIPIAKVNDVAKAIDKIDGVKVGNILETIGVIVADVDKTELMQSIRQVNGVEKVEMED